MRQVVRWVPLLAASCLLLTSPLMGHGASQEDLLVDQFNSPVPPKRLAGHWLLVYFGYLQCPDICPAALTRMNQVLAQLGSQGAQILPIFITLDPDHDTPPKLRDFAARFNPRLLAITGSPAAVAEAASQFGVAWHRGAGPHELDHGALWYLVSPDNRVVRVVHPTQPVAEIAQTIRKSLEHP